MRIISGKYRGKTLASFSGSAVRPTADRVKESLFNILSAVFYGASFLDIFCGRVSLGIECISRGASFVKFNDVSKDSIALLKKNLKGIEGNFKITNLDYTRCIEPSEKFDLIFIDPPYMLDYGVAALQLASKALS